MVYVANEDVERVLVGVPSSHKHLRAALFLKGGYVVIFSEATLANLVRAYVTVKTHPKRRAVELRARTRGEAGPFKEGYADCQLLEEDTCDEVISGELSKLLALAKRWEFGSAPGV